MGRIASKEDFEEGGLYTEYIKFPFFEQRAEFILQNYSTTKTILVAGCGWGYLVEELVTRGFDTWGCDISDYAINKAIQVLPKEISTRIIKADITNKKQMKGICKITQVDRFDLCITEDILPIMKLYEIPLLLDALQSISKKAIHIVSCSNPTIPGDLDRRDPSLIWKSRKEWESFLGGEVINTEYK